MIFAIAVNLTEVINDGVFIAVGKFNVDFYAHPSKGPLKADCNSRDISTFVSLEFVKRLRIGRCFYRKCASSVAVGVLNQG